MKKYLLIPLLLLFTFSAFAQTHSTPLTYRVQNTPTNSKDSVGYSYDGKIGNYSYLGNLELLRSLFKLKADSVSNSGYVTHGYFNAHSGGSVTTLYSGNGVIPSLRQVKLEGSSAELFIGDTLNTTGLDIRTNTARKIAVDISAQNDSTLSKSADIVLSDNVVQFTSNIIGGNIMQFIMGGGPAHNRMWVYDYQQRGLLSAGDYSTFQISNDSAYTSRKAVNLLIAANPSNFIGLSALSATSPIFYNNSTGVISSQAATGSVNGYLTPTDWNTFNNKQASLVSGTNIKTINSTSLLGSGNINTFNGTITANSTTNITGTNILTFKHGTDDSFNLYDGELDYNTLSDNSSIRNDIFFGSAGNPGSLEVDIPHQSGTGGGTETFSVSRGGFSWSNSIGGFQATVLGSNHLSLTDNATGDVYTSVASTAIGNSYTNADITVTADGQLSISNGSGGSGVTAVTGTTSRTTSTGGTTPQIDISATFEALLEKVANKATTFGVLNNTLYPSTQAVANYVAASSPVTTVFGRTGAVVAASNDYTFAQIGTKPTTVFGYGITDALTPTGAQSVSNKTFLPANTYQTSLGTPGTDSVVVKNSGGLRAISPTYYQVAGSYLLASNFITSETPSGTINSSNVTFTLANTPTSGTVRLFQNGLRLSLTTDYTLSSGTVTFVTAPTTGDILLADYQK